tara:strand:- start:409 stop:816 length:408 start_codon:yes stop_codon:yes gene_type:complete
MSDNLFKTKYDIDLDDLQKLQPAIWIIFTGALLYCHRNGLTCRITSIISDRGDDVNARAKSKTHQSGRAIDIGVREEDGWTDLHISRLTYLLCKDYEDIAALSHSDLSPRAAIAKSDHIHLQCRPNADVSKFIKE